MVKFLNVLGTFGYVGVFLQWFWAILLYLPSILKSEFLKSIMPQGSSCDQVIPTPSTDGVAKTIEIPIAVSWVVFVLAIFLVIGLLYLMVSQVAKTAAKAGKTITHVPAEGLGKIIAEKQQLKPKQRRALSASLIVTIKLFLIFVPLIAAFFAASVVENISSEVITIVGMTLFALSLVLFATQYVASSLQNIPYDKIR